MLRSSARLSDELHGLEKFALGARAWRLRSALIEATAILKFHTLVEAEEVWSADGSINPSDVLALIMEVGKRECVVPRKLAHVLKGILRISHRVVGADGKTCHAERLEIASVPNSAIDDGLHIRTVIADEHHQRAMLAFEIGEAVRLSIRRWEPETRGLAAKLTFRW
jgi:hypothetical protein